MHDPTDGRTKPDGTPDEDRDDDAGDERERISDPGGDSDPEPETG